MHRIVGGVLALMLFTPALWAQDKPATPAEQYQQLLKQYQEAMKTFQDALKDAKTPEERQKVITEKNPRITSTPKLAPKFLELAENNPKDAIAVDALLWVVSNLGIGAKGDSSKAMDLLLRDHMDSDKLGRLCQLLGSGSDKKSDEMLRAILAKNSHKSVQAEASLALAQHQNSLANIVNRMKDDPQFSKMIEQTRDKDTFEELKKMEPGNLEAECEKAFGEFAKQYASDMALERLAIICQQGVFSGSKGMEVLVRMLLEKDPRREVRGIACLALGQMQMQRANRLPESEAKAAKELQQESEKNFELAAEKYADVKLLSRGTVGEKAQGELFDLRHLSVGKEAPDVEGDDQDGKKFKLSEYKGKVVLLDFWSQF